MREFSRAYLDRTRRGMWADDRTALTDLDLGSRQRVLDAGCGTGEFTTVLREETDATVVGLDADPSLAATADERFGASDAAENPPSVCVGSADRLPFPADTFDLVVCQALLVNVPDPPRFLREFRRVSSELVAAIEPVNSDVAVESTVAREPALEAEARDAFISGAPTGVAGASVADWFTETGLTDRRVRRYHHEKRVEPPYSEADLRSASRKAIGAGLADHETELRAALSADAYDDLRARWRAMGRDVIEQMREETYRRVERVPFDVIVARLD